MWAQFITVAILSLFSAMLPGPDFAMVTKNSVLFSRRAGIFTSLGIASAVLIHISYCALGLAILISQSIVIFTIIKFIGAAYLIYLGVNSILFNPHLTIEKNPKGPKRIISDWVAFRQGFLCNALNPKASLFFLALFTMIIKPGTPQSWIFVYAMEIFVIVACWFCTLTIILSHPKVLKLLGKMENYISKILGVFLIGFGIALSVIKHSST